jgi:hypothetical protein
MKTRHALLLGFSLFVLTSCATISIESAKSNTQLTTIDNIYVVLDLGANVADFTNYVSDHFRAKFQESQINAEIHALTGLEINSDSVVSDLRAKGFKYLLVVTLLEAILSNGYQTDGIYDLSAYDVRTEDRIWRAKAKLGRMGIGVDDAADKFVNEVINALAKDGLL